MAKKPFGFSTRCVHGHGHQSDGRWRTARPVSVPIVQTSTFAFDNADHGAAIFAGEDDGFLYTRLGNPTQEALEQRMAALEGAEAALAVASGMAAATTAVLTLCECGDHIVSGDTLYGGTHQLFSHTLPRLGIEVTEINATDPAHFEAAITDKTKLIYVETPANPTLVLTNIPAVAEIAHAHGLPLLVDNTFCTPALQRPVEMGADIILHSGTKYIGGHGDAIAGLLVGDAEFITRARFETLRDVGGCISPFNAWLLIRGLKTLPIRMEKHCENAMTMARWLVDHPKVIKVNHPGLDSHPQHELAVRQQDGFGGLITFEIEGGREAGKTVMDNVKLCTLAVSLGDVDTLIEHPATMTHSTYSEDELRHVGIAPAMIRLSVGLEDPTDIMADLDQAIARI